MAAYISVPRDLTRVKSKILFNLTKRQLICFSVAAIVANFKKSRRLSCLIFCVRKG